MGYGLVALYQRRRQALRPSFERRADSVAQGVGERGSDAATVQRFGLEWKKFDQRRRPPAELRDSFERYFSVFPWDRLPPDAVGADIGCGTGRWAHFVAPRVGTLYCIDASPAALEVARSNLAAVPNCALLAGAAGALPLPPNTLDFAYCLGVLHHTPDPQFGLRDIVRALKPGAPLLIYVYYSLEQRPRWYRLLWA